MHLSQFLLTLVDLCVCDLWGVSNWKWNRAADCLKPWWLPADERRQPSPSFFPAERFLITSKHLWFCRTCVELIILTFQKTKPAKKPPKTKTGHSVVLSGVALPWLCLPSASQKKRAGLHSRGRWMRVGACVGRGISSKVLHWLGKIHCFTLRVSREGEWKLVIFLSDVFKPNFLPWRNTAVAASE